MSIAVDATAGVVTITLQGQLGRHEILAAFDSLLGHPEFRKGMDTLWDLRAASAEQITNADIQAIVIRVWEAHERRGPGKVAIVVEQEIDYGLSRMFEQLASQKVPNPIMVFRAFGDATTWLSIGRVS